MAKGKSEWAKIERSREVRLWITQVLVPAAGTVVLVWSNPQAREFVKTKFDNGKAWLASKLQPKKPVE